MLLHKTDSVAVGDFIHQLKLDGFRCTLHIEGEHVSCLHVTRTTAQANFPSLARHMWRCSITINPEMRLHIPLMVFLHGMALPRLNSGELLTKRCCDILR
jgi:hypothetical protein